MGNRLFRISILHIIALFIGNSCIAKNQNKEVAARLKTDIMFLASDDLEGRRTSSNGEAKAAAYIIARYKELGIEPYKGKYQYPFDFTYGKRIGDSTQIKINGEAVTIGKDCFPLPFSANKNCRGETILDFNQRDKIWVVSLYKEGEQANSPHFDWEKAMNEKAREAEKFGAKGIVFFDSFGTHYAPVFKLRSDFDPVSIPVIYISKKNYNKYIKSSTTKSVVFDFSISIKKSERTGTNIASYIDNKAAYTVVLGAHYDHLGYGEDGNSLGINSENEHKIHYGADDNASGTAALLEEAKWIKENKKLKNFNYLFINFSGEELGLYGSKAIVKEQNLDSSYIAYMLNMDMVGRLDESTRTLTLGGVGTSPQWKDVVALAGKDFNLTIDSTGRGPSDHTSFYNVGIPVLFVFTGTHLDYHKPSDVPEKINYDGEVNVLNFINKILLKIDNEKTKPVYAGNQTSSLGKVNFKVTLGIVPDYTSREGGVRVDGVLNGRPAEKAGITRGDIIIQLGNCKIQSMQSYMEALDKFAPEEKTTVTILRNGKNIILPIVLSKK